MLDACTHLRLWSVTLSDPLPTIEDAAQLLGIVPATVRTMIANGELSAVQLCGHAGRPLRILSSSLNARLAGGLPVALAPLVAFRIAELSTHRDFSGGSGSSVAIWSTCRAFGCCTIRTQAGCSPANCSRFRSGRHATG
jgi:excisionase family DNA binding protein